MNATHGMIDAALEIRRAPPRRPGLAGNAVAALPLAALPILAAAAFWNAPPWALMWSMAFGMYAGCKWLTWRRADRRGVPLWRSWGYFLLWPGMDSAAFLHGRASGKIPRAEWLAAAAKTLLGAALIWLAARRVAEVHPLAGAWAAGCGYVLILHCGIFHFFSLAWRAAGVDAPPLMNAPLISRTLGEFWGARWNTAFIKLSHDFLQRPLMRRLDLPAATLVTFFVSGLIHDLLLSFPEGDGYGLPTAYFTLQGFALLFQRSRTARSWGLDRGAAGRAFTLAVAGLPAYWLFHPAFMNGVMAPFLRAIGAM